MRNPIRAYRLHRSVGVPWRTALRGAVLYWLRGYSGKMKIAENTYAVH